MFCTYGILTFNYQNISVGHIGRNKAQYCLPFMKKRNQFIWSICLNMLQEIYIKKKKHQKTNTL